MRIIIVSSWNWSLTFPVLFYVYVTRQSTDCQKEISKENIRRYNRGLYLPCSLFLVPLKCTQGKSQVWKENVVNENENPSLNGIKWPVFEYTTWNLNPIDSVIIDKGWGSNQKTSMMLITFVAFIALYVPCVDSLHSRLDEWVKQKKRFMITDKWLIHPWWGPISLWQKLYFLLTVVKPWTCLLPQHPWTLVVFLVSHNLSLRMLIWNKY